MDAMLCFVVIHPKNLPLKLGQNSVSNSWDITDFEFPVVGGGQSFSCQTQLKLCYVEVSWGYGNSASA